MGEWSVEGTKTRGLKRGGEPVEKDEPLFEISTDKVDAEIPSPVAGVLTEIRFPEGATVEINTVVAVLGGTSGAGERAAGAGTPVPAPTATPFETTKAASKSKAKPSTPEAHTAK